MYTFMAMRAIEVVEMPFRKKNRPPKKRLPSLVMKIEVLYASSNFLGVEFVRKAISTISMARMAMKVYIVGKEIERAFI